MLVTGYANNGKNEGFKVELSSENSEVQRELSKIQVPHITLSVAKGCSPIRTSNLMFKNIPSFSFKGTIGAYTNKGPMF